MDQNKINKIITNAVFGVVLIVPLVIGISLYSRQEPLPVPPPPVYVRPTPYPSAIPTPVTYSRMYISGTAYDSNTQKPITGKIITYSTQMQVATQADGSFYIPADAGTQSVNIKIEGYNSKLVNVGYGYNQASAVQLVGQIFFDPEKIEWNASKDPKLKVTVSYPNTWTYQKVPFNTQTGESTEMFYFSFAPVDQSYMTFISLSNTPDTYNTGSLEAYSKSYNVNDSGEASRVKVTIGGKPAIKILSKTGQITILMMRESDHMIFSWLYFNSDGSQQKQKIFDQMVEKFEY